VPIIDCGDGRTLYDFGHGDIYIGIASRVPGGWVNRLAFMAGPARTIGETDEALSNLPVEESGCKLQFRFGCVASLDVLIERATELRARMIAHGFEDPGKVEVQP
jgi:hypothetical protein